MHVKQDLPSLDVETLWSSMFWMIKKKYACRRAINATINRIPELLDTCISENTWNTAHKVCNFLEAAAVVTEIQSESSNVTLSRSAKLLCFLESKCDSMIRANDPILTRIASAMHEKL